MPILPSARNEHRSWTNSPFRAIVGWEVAVAARRFNPSSPHPARAVQAWQILVGLAKNRQTITYGGLSKLMYGKRAQGVLAKILGHVAFFCEDEDLPPLTSIVVVKGVGVASDGIPVDQTRLDEYREQVYDFDWYDLYPPSEAQLTAAYDAHR